MTAAEVCARIRDIGILPGIRVPSAEDALFAASEMYRCGIPIVELTMTVPGALGVLKELRRDTPSMVVGAGTVLDVGTAQACIDAGAQFITSPGLNRELVEFTVAKKICAVPGALSPSEIMTALHAGADMIKLSFRVSAGRGTRIHQSVARAISRCAVHRVRRRNPAECG